MIPPEILAIAAAFCMALSGMFYAELRGKVGVVALTRWQTVTAFLLTGTVATLARGWGGLAFWQLRNLAGSGLFAIIIASSALNAAVFALGPRRAALIFSLNAPLTAILAYLVLGETVAPLKLAGIALVVAGIVLAILFVRPEGPASRSEPPVSGRALSRGVLLGVLAAFGQAIGTLLARPAMAAGIDPFAAMCVRAGAAALFFVILPLLPFPAAGERRQVSWRMLLTGVLGACIGIGFGMSLLMAALAHGEAGVISTLSSLVPILVLPMIWVRTGRPPAGWAWLGAALAVAGTGLLALG